MGQIAGLWQFWQNGDLLTDLCLILRYFVVYWRIYVWFWDISWFWQFWRIPCDSVGFFLTINRLFWQRKTSNSVISGFITTKNHTNGSDGPNVVTKRSPVNRAEPVDVAVPVFGVVWWGGTGTRGNGVRTPWHHRGTAPGHHPPTLPVLKSSFLIAAFSVNSWNSEKYLKIHEI